jgi:hypothetical protein
MALARSQFCMVLPCCHANDKMGLVVKKTDKMGFEKPPMSETKRD